MTMVKSSSRTPSQAPVDTPPLADGVLATPPRKRLLIGPHDVLFGKAKRTIDNPGNKRFRELIADNAPIYKQETQAIYGEKKRFVDQLIGRVHSSGGRFLRDGGGFWAEAPINLVREKVSQALRDVIKKREKQLRNEAKEQRKEASLRSFFQRRLEDQCSRAAAHGKRLGGASPPFTSPSTTTATGGQLSGQQNKCPPSHPAPVATRPLLPPGLQLLQQSPQEREQLYNHVRTWFGTASAPRMVQKNQQQLQQWKNDQQQSSRPPQQERIVQQQANNTAGPRPNNNRDKHHPCWWEQLPSISIKIDR